MEEIEISNYLSLDTQEIIEGLSEILEIPEESLKEKDFEFILDKCIDIDNSGFYRHLEKKIQKDIIDGDYDYEVDERMTELEIKENCSSINTLITVNPILEQIKKLSLSQLSKLESFFK